MQQQPRTTAARAPIAAAIGSDTIMSCTNQASSYSSYSYSSSSYNNYNYSY